MIKVIAVHIFGAYKKQIALSYCLYGIIDHMIGRALRNDKKFIMIMSMYWHMLINIRNRIGKSGLSVQRILFFSKYRYFHLSSPLRFLISIYYKNLTAVNKKHNENCDILLPH